MKDRLCGNCPSHHLASRQPPSKLGEPLQMYSSNPFLSFSLTMCKYVLKLLLLHACNHGGNNSSPPCYPLSLYFGPFLNFLRPDFAPGPPWSTERKRGRGRSEVDGFPQDRRPTGVKEPPVEKKTEAFTVAPQESQWCGGFGRPDKQPSPLSNQTLCAGKHSEKTQNGTDFWRQDPRGSSPRDHHLPDGDNTDSEGSGPETSQRDLPARDERVASPPCHEVCLFVC